jgi:hypothetical protein
VEPLSTMKNVRLHFATFAINLFNVAIRPVSL